MPPPPIGQWLTDSKLLSRIRAFYTKAAVEPEPLISERAAFLCAVLFTVFYVAPFYLSSTLRTGALTSRDAPSVIRARVRAVGLTCLACIVVAVYVLMTYGHATPHEVLRLCGIWPFDPLDVAKVLGLVMVLFTCSLYESIVVDAGWREWSPRAFKNAIWDDWTGYRNLLIAPASEELVWRALTIPLFLLAKSSPLRIVFLTPLVFGLAHLHHLATFVQARTPPGQRLPPLKIILHGIVMSLFQSTYTSMFGFFAAFVFLRTGNLWAIIVAHSFCNHMGFPRLWGRVGQAVYDDVAAKPAVEEIALGKRDDAPLPSTSVQSTAKLRNISIAWTVVYYVLLFAGAYAFQQLLFPLTESSNALAKF